jgi:predicted YcjX-like family ATPase
VNPFRLARGLIPVRQTVRIGVTGLARAGKTALLTSLAANLLAVGAGFPALPALAGKNLRVRLSPEGATGLPRFDHLAHLAALEADPPRWPGRTGAVSLLALDIDVASEWTLLPDRLLRLELLDYPGEWLLDLSLLSKSFGTWSEEVLRRLEGNPAANDFLAFAHAVPAAADESVARAGAALYTDLLVKLRDGEGLSLLTPGRFLMPAPGPLPPWHSFHPMRGDGAYARLLAARYDQYLRSVRRELSEPAFARVDRLVVLADVLSALHAGETAFADAAAALGAVAEALRWQRLPEFLPDWLADVLPIGGIRRVAFAASKADHVAERQRGNLAALVGALTRTPGRAETTALAVAAVRCTEDFVWTLDGRPVSAVRGRVEGQGIVGSYPGEVPDRPPGPEFWAHDFLRIPDLQPMRLPLGGRGGVPHINLDVLLAFLLEDVL